MKQVVVADTGPLIILAGVGHLHLLRNMYGTIHIPEMVREELQIGTAHPETEIIGDALQKDWIKVHTVKTNAYSGFQQLKQLVDPGEAEAIVLAKTINCDFLLIDDRKGRKIAVNHGLRVVGVAGFLLAAKQQKHIETVKPLLNAMSTRGYRLSYKLYHEVVKIAGEK